MAHFAVTVEVWICSEVLHSSEKLPHKNCKILKWEPLPPMQKGFSFSTRTLSDKAAVQNQAAIDIILNSGPYGVQNKFSWNKRFGQKDIRPLRMRLTRKLNHPPTTIPGSSSLRSAFWWKTRWMKRGDFPALGVPGWTTFTSRVTPALGQGEPTERHAMSIWGRLINNKVMLSVDKWRWICMTPGVQSHCAKPAGGNMLDLFKTGFGGSNQQPSRKAVIAVWNWCVVALLEAPWINLFVHCVKGSFSWLTIDARVHVRISRRTITGSSRLCYMVNWCREIRGSMDSWIIQTQSSRPSYNTNTFYSLQVVL